MSFLSANGAGAAALIAVGAVCAILGLMGHWPSRISMAGNEVSWESVDQAVNSQIQVAADNDESEAALAELRSLRDRLAKLQRTGSVPRHPAQVYDDDVTAAIRRLLPSAEITQRAPGVRAVADFAIRYRDRLIYAETKWRDNPERSFAGSTLPPLLRALPPDARLLVIANTSVPPLPQALEAMQEAMGDRGRIVCWLDATDDAALAAALTALLDQLLSRRGKPGTSRPGAHT